MIIAQLDFWINTLPPPTRERHYDALRTKIDM